MKKREPLTFAGDEETERRRTLATEFYEAILAPDEESLFVSDEATLRDVSIAPDEELIQKIENHYGHRMSRWDFQRSFWSLLDQLQRSRQTRSG